MLTKLMQVNSAQEHIIRSQAALIDELFVLVCQNVTDDELKGIDPLLTSLQDVVDRSKKL